MYWQNGQFYEDGQGALLPSDRGFTLGDGIFTTLKCHNGKPLFWSDHVQRLKQASTVFGLPFDAETFQNQAYTVVCQLLHQNHPTTNDAVCRVTVSRGTGVRGLVPPASEQINPTIVITTSPFPVIITPVETIAFISSIRRNETSPTSRYKTLCYLDNILGLQEAVQTGATEALFLNTTGNLACSSVGNVVLKTPCGQFHTPPLADGTIEGLTLKSLKSVYSVIEQSIFCQSLEQYSAILTINSLRGATPIDFVTGIGSDKKRLTFPESRILAQQWNEQLQKFQSQKV